MLNSLGISVLPSTQDKTKHSDFDAGDSINEMMTQINSTNWSACDILTKTNYLYTN